MCGRTSLFTPVERLEARFDATVDRALSPRYNVAPGDDLAVVTDDRPDRIDLLRWGLVPSWVDDAGDWPSPINARAETLAEKPAFRDAFERRRCLVLADGFYEWTGVRGTKQPYRVALEDDAPFAMAGLWERRRADDEVLTTCTVVTTTANETVAPLHDRMPVVLSPDEESVWLSDGTGDERRSLLDPYDGGDMRAYPVSRAVNDPANDGPEIVRPAGHEQSGLDDFA